MAIWSSFFNCYHQHYLLIPINGYGADNTPHIREGVTQGVPLGMVTYSIGVLPLTKRLKLAHTDVT